MRVRALRGATSVDNDRAEDITEATSELLARMMALNHVGAGDLVSILFTATPDLRAGFPAAAARELGLGDVPLLCASEIDVAGGLARCIRVLMHLYSERTPAELRHVYLRDAHSLRPDQS
ncbi:MAG TPA: chorismate mutase [Actinomycetota bacterium]|nr:chorismate mutase [Actinomycetota bacterium]